MFFTAYIYLVNAIRPNVTTFSQFCSLTNYLFIIIIYLFIVIIYLFILFFWERKRRGMMCCEIICLQRTEYIFLVLNRGRVIFPQL